MTWMPHSVVLIHLVYRLTFSYPEESWHQRCGDATLYWDWLPLNERGVASEKHSFFKEGEVNPRTLPRPDISYAVNLVSQFMHCPRTSHLRQAYFSLSLKHTLTFCLKRSPNSLQKMSAYSDADWAGCPDDRRSTSGLSIWVLILSPGAKGNKIPFRSQVGEIHVWFHCYLSGSRESKKLAYPALFTVW